MAAPSAGEADERAAAAAGPGHDARTRPPRSRRRVWSGVLLVLAGASLYLLLPSALAVFGSWDSLRSVELSFAVAALACEAASFACLCELDRISLRTPARYPVVAARLAANAVGRILPGGGATATAFAASMLSRAGFETKRTVAALATSSALRAGAVFALPALALPAVLGGAGIDRGLEVAAYLGAALLVLLVALGAAVFTSDAPLELAGRAIQWLLNATARRHSKVTGLPQSLLAARDFTRATLGGRRTAAVLAAAGSVGFDYVALLLAIRAVGAEPRPALVLLAYTTAALLAFVPFTPSGIGFVEAGLAGTLTLAGVSAGDALAATLLYRVVSFWLTLPAGGVAYVLFRRRYGRGRTDRRPLAPSGSKR
jgi:uncharacterized protein (TIRG00374 family)